MVACFPLNQARPQAATEHNTPKGPWSVITVHRYEGPRSLALQRYVLSPEGKLELPFRLWVSREIDSAHGSF